MTEKTVGEDPELRADLEKLVTDAFRRGAFEVCDKMILAFQLVGGPLTTPEMKDLRRALTDCAKMIRKQYEDR